MKKCYRFILTTVMFISIFIISDKVQAASADLSLKASGNTITATVSVNAAQWDLKVFGSEVTANGSSRFSELDNASGNLSKIQTFTFTAPGPGNYTITLTGDVTDINGFKNTVISIPKTVTVTAPSTPSTPSNSNEEDDNLPTASNGETTTTVKSSNNYLKSLTLSTGSISFNRKTTKYTVNVPENTESIKVTGTAEHEKATVQGNGAINLKKGNNTINVVVTAENGSARTYTLTVIRAGEEEKEEEENQVQEHEAIGAITSLKLKGVKDSGEIVEILLTPEFSKDIFYYECEIPEGINFIDVEKQCDIIDAIVEVTGNDNLVDGENLINVIVKYTDENGEEQTVTYQISAKKQAVDITQEIQEEQNGLGPIQIGVIAGSTSIAAIIIIVLIVKYCIQQKKNEDEKDFGEYGEPFYSDDEEEIFEKPIGNLKRKEEEKIEEAEQESLESNENKTKEAQQDINEWEEFEQVKKKRIFGKSAKKGKHF